MEQKRNSGWRWSEAKRGRGDGASFPPAVAGRAWLYAWAAIAVAAVTLSACTIERRKTDAELGLSPTQATGRHIFDRQCGGCHEAYSSRGLKGPSLQGLYRHPYLKNGMPANDERVHQIVVFGRAKMPPFQRALTPEQVQALMDYLHTL